MRSTAPNTPFLRVLPSVRVLCVLRYDLYIDTGITPYRANYARAGNLSRCARIMALTLVLPMCVLAAVSAMVCPALRNRITSATVSSMILRGLPSPCACNPRNISRSNCATSVRCNQAITVSIRSMSACDNIISSSKWSVTLPTT